MKLKRKKPHKQKWVIELETAAWRVYLGKDVHTSYVLKSQVFWDSLFALNLQDTFCIKVLILDSGSKTFWH